MSEIAKNQQEFDRKSARIRQDADLSRQAKQRMLGEIYAEARDTHDRLVAEHREQTQKNIAQARKQVMGIKYPKMMLQADHEHARVSYRDAYDRAERAASRLRKDPAAMADLLERADLSGDDLLAQACHHIATKKGLRAVSEAYLRNRPSEAATFQKLSDAQDAANGSQLYGWIPPRKPPDLSGAAAPGERFDEVGRDGPDLAAAAAASSSARQRISIGHDYPARTTTPDDS